MIITRFTEHLEKSASFICEHLYLSQLTISPCTSCFACAENGVCPIADDMQDCYRAIAEADIIVIGTPVYFNSVPSGLKAFIDRCQPFYCKKYHLKQPMKAKYGYLLACCDLGKADPFIGVEKTIEAFFCSCNTTLREKYYCVLNGKQFKDLSAENVAVANLGKKVLADLNN
jgi:multimeric flavodoxin WrbA